MDLHIKEMAVAFYWFMERWQQIGTMGYTKRLTKEDMEKLDTWPDLETLEFFTLEQLFNQFIEETKQQ